MHNQEQDVYEALAELQEENRLLHEELMKQASEIAAIKQEKRVIVEGQLMRFYPDHFILQNNKIFRFPITINHIKFADSFHVKDFAQLGRYLYQTVKEGMKECKK